MPQGPTVERAPHDAEWVDDALDLPHSNHPDEVLRAGKKFRLTTEEAFLNIVANKDFYGSNSTQNIQKLKEVIKSTENARDMAGAFRRVGDACRRVLKIFP